MTIMVVGLGPAGWDGLTVAAAAALESTKVAETPLFLRTGRHPVVADLDSRGVPFSTFDGAYAQAETLEDAYGAIVARLLDEAIRGHDVVYAVPGSPMVAERSVQSLVSAAADRGVRVRFLDGMSFVEPALAAMGTDPSDDGLLVADGRRIGEQFADWGLVGGPEAPPRPPSLLVSQVDSTFVLSEVKLACLDVWPPEHEVVLLEGLATPDVAVRRVPLAEVDHDAAPGHLACLFVPAGESLGGGRPAHTSGDGAGIEGVETGMPFPVLERHRRAGESFARLVALMDRLRSPGGCPWDAEQTHRSLVRHLLEESYEVADVIEGLPPEAPAGDLSEAGEAYDLLAGELGDYLLQAVFQARLAEDARAFDASTVCDRIVAKLVHRHPHVFGDAVAETADDVLPQWEARKAAEKAHASAFDDVPAALPALVRAAKLQKRAVDRAGMAAPDLRDVEREFRAVLDELGGPAGDAGDTVDVVGRALFLLVALARAVGVADAEGALRASARAWERAARDVESRGEPGATAVSLILLRDRTTGRGT